MLMKARKTRILAELPAHLLTRPRPLLLAGVFGVSLMGVVGATAVAPQTVTADIAFERVLETLPPPALVAEPVGDLPFVNDERIQPGDTLASIFRRIGADDAEALAFLSASDEGKQAIRQLRAGRSVTALVGRDGRIASLSLPIGSSSERLVVERSGNEELRIVEDQAAATTTMVEMRSGVIRHSLFGATDAAGIPDSIATQMAELFGTEIDFHTDLRKDDSFNVIYEMLYSEGTSVRAGRILAAEFVNQGKRHAVVLYRGAGGKEQYYTDEGRSLRQGFLRSPLEFSRVTSGFGRRLHPIHKSWRSHNGVDFGAPTGTPIKATSDGIVEFAASQRGYGNLVVLRHRGKFSTAYAHLNGFARGLKKGQEVSQGDIIGYVGSTGWATGPHLHYEVRIDNKPQDPLTVALPAADTLDARGLAAFKRETAPMLQRLALLNYETTTVASAGN